MAKFLDESGLATLWSLIKAEDVKTLGAGVKIATGSYKGTGKGGASNPNSLTFDFVPKLVFIKFDISAGEADWWLFIPYCYTNQYFGYAFAYKGTMAYSCYARVNDKTMSWYSDKSSTQGIAEQANYSGYTYHYFAIGE